MNDTITYILTTNGLLFLLSVIFYIFPAKNINRFYGYRTHKASQNKEIWKFANTVFNKNLLIYAAISLVAIFSLALATQKELSWQPMLFVVLTIVVSIVKTENALKENFTDEGKRKG
jgi:uncharacterized membrane protein